MKKHRIGLVRLHGDKVICASGYTRRALDEWASRIREWHRRADVYVYFDNDVRVRAPYDAQALMRKLGLCWPADADMASGEDERWNFNRPAPRGGSRPRSRTRTGGIPARR